jgi:hypothetical protein
MYRPLWRIQGGLGDQELSNFGVRGQCDLLEEKNEEGATHVGLILGQNTGHTKVFI